MLHRIRVADVQLPASPRQINRNPMKSTFLSQIHFPSRQQFKTNIRWAHTTSSLTGDNNINISSRFTHFPSGFPKARNNITRVAVHYQTIESDSINYFFKKNGRTGDKMEVKHRDRDEEIVKCLRVNI